MKNTKTTNKPSKALDALIINVDARANVVLCLTSSMGKQTAAVSQRPVLFPADHGIPATTDRYGRAARALVGLRPRELGLVPATDRRGAGRCGSRCRHLESRRGSLDLRE